MFSRSHAYNILEIINDIFGDIPDQCLEDGSDSSLEDRERSGLQHMIKHYSCTFISGQEHVGEYNVVQRFFLWIIINSINSTCMSQMK